MVTLGKAPTNIVVTGQDSTVSTGIEILSTSFPFPTITNFQLGYPISVKDPAYGAKGDGVTDDTSAIQAAINAVFVTEISAVPPPTSNLGVLFFPAGNYLVSSPLILNGVVGAKIMGSGRLTTTITDTTGNGIFKTNGLAFSWISDIQFEQANAGTTSVLFDLDWVSGSGFLSTKGNTFINCFFQNGGTGVRIGNSGAQCSENHFFNCHFVGINGNAIEVDSFNSLTQSVYGGNFQSCGTGIMVNSGSVPIISGVGFQGSVNWDIDIERSANDCYQIQGCRSESVNFLNAQRGQVVVSGCEHTSTGTGLFVNMHFHNCVLIGCIAAASQLGTGSSSRRFTAISCEFGLVNWAQSAVKGRIINTRVGGLSDSGTGSIIADAEFLGDGTNTNLKSSVGAQSNTFANLPDSPIEGTIASITDGKAANCADGTCTTFGTTVTAGGGALNLAVWYNGTNWTLIGK